MLLCLANRKSPVRPLSAAPASVWRTQLCMGLVAPSHTGHWLSKQLSRGSIPARPHSLIPFLTHSDYVFLCIPFPLELESGKSMTRLGVACAQLTFQMLTLLQIYLYCQSQYSKTWDTKCLALLAQVVRAFGMNLKVGEPSPSQVEIFSGSKTLTLSQEHLFGSQKLMLCLIHSSISILD